VVPIFSVISTFFVIPAKAGIQYAFIVVEKASYVYIMASARNGTLYVGVTSDLIRRVCEHQQGIQKGFTKKYGVKTLVYYECGNSIESAIYREKKSKNGIALGN
jgi:putative endonuclease